MNKENLITSLQNNMENPMEKENTLANVTLNPKEQAIKILTDGILKLKASENPNEDIANICEELETLTGEYEKEGEESDTNYTNLKNKLTNNI